VQQEKQDPYRIIEFSVAGEKVILMIVIPHYDK